jgi:hypothetical protein
MAGSQPPDQEHHPQRRASREASRHRCRLTQAPGHRKAARPEMGGQPDLSPGKEPRQPAGRRRAAWRTPFPDRAALLRQEFLDTARLAGHRWPRPPDRFGKQPSRYRGQLPKAFQSHRLAHRPPASPDQLALHAGSRAAIGGVVRKWPKRSGHASIPKELPPSSNPRTQAGLGNVEPVIRPVSSIRQPFSQQLVVRHQTMKQPGQPQGREAGPAQTWRQVPARPKPQPRKQGVSAGRVVKMTRLRWFQHATAVLRKRLSKPTFHQNRRRTLRLTPPTNSAQAVKKRCKSLSTSSKPRRVRRGSPWSGSR